MKLFDPPRLTGRYLSRVLQSGWLTTGPRCQELQEAVAERMAVRPDCVVLGASATACWQGVLDLTQPSRVHITNATWPGMKQVAEHTNPCVLGNPIFVRTDIGGARCDDAPWGSTVGCTVRDACHSWVLDNSADFTLFSFYPTKLVPGAEGGCVVCRRPQDAERLRLHLYCGLRPGEAGQGRGPVLCGRKANMTDVTAALNLEALELSPAYIKAIGDAWAQLADCARARGLPFRIQLMRPYLFQVELPADQVRPTIDALKLLGIPSAWNFPPAGLLTLPCYPGMTLTDADRVIDAVSKAAPSR